MEDLCGELLIGATERGLSVQAGPLGFSSERPASWQAGQRVTHLFVDDVPRILDTVIL